MPGVGALMDGASVVLGCVAGVLLGNRVPKKMHELVAAALALFLVVLGIYQTREIFAGEFALAVGGAASIVVLGSLLLGGVLGASVDVERRLDQAGNLLQRRFSGHGGSEWGNGFVSTTLVVCVGPMAVLSSFAEGLRGDLGLVLVKSALDFFVSLAFASALGWGVAFAAVPLVVYQGALTVLARTLEGVMVPSVVAGMTGVGGIIVAALGVRLLEIKNIAVANLLPALVLCPAATMVVLGTQ